MATDLDTLSAASIITSIKSCSKSKLLSFVETLSKSDIQNFLFTSLKQSHPPMQLLVDNTWNYLPEMQDNCSTKICRYFVNKSEIIQSSSLTKMPTTIVAFIISFGTMYERLKLQLICKDFYNFCNDPTAKYHLIVDHKFVKAIYDNHITYSKFINSKYIHLKYVFKNKLASLQKYGDFESKYYKFIAKILLKSPSLHTINYHLKYQTFKSDLLSKISSRYGDPGYLNQWVRNVQQHNTAAAKRFKNVQNLIWIPSQVNLYRGFFGWDSKRMDKYLPNLTSINIPKVRFYASNYWYRSDNHDEFLILKDPFYYNKLQHITYNMLPKRRAIRLRNGEHIDIDRHPLYNFYNFKNLRSFDLTLPIFDQCAKYYNYNSARQKFVKYKCIDLSQLRIEFDSTVVTLFAGLGPPTVVNTFSTTANQIIKYILSFCPNMNRYTFVGNGLFDISGEHLIGYYDRLEFLDTDCIEILPQNQRLSGLKSLTIRFYYNSTSVNEIMEKLDLSLYPYLQSFKLVCVNNITSKCAKLNTSVIDFLSYLVKQKVKLNSSKLKYVTFEHVTLNKNKEVQLQRKQFFNATKCAKNLSQKICQLIISLMVSENSLNFNLESILLKPIGMRQIDIDYLSFWFGGEFGAFNAEKFGTIKNDLFLTDVLCINHNIS